MQNQLQLKILRYFQLLHQLMQLLQKVRQLIEQILAPPHSHSARALKVLVELGCDKQNHRVNYADQIKQLLEIQQIENQ